MPKENPARLNPLKVFSLPNNKLRFNKTYCALLVKVFLKAEYRLKNETSANRNQPGKLFCSRWEVVVEYQLRLNIKLADRVLGF